MLQLYIVFKHKQTNILYKKALLTQFFIKSILLPKKQKKIINKKSINNIFILTLSINALYQSFYYRKNI